MKVIAHIISKWKYGKHISVYLIYYLVSNLFWWNEWHFLTIPAYNSQLIIAKFKQLASSWKQIFEFIKFWFASQLIHIGNNVYSWSS